MSVQAWCVTDGAAGCVSQVVGLASAMGLGFEEKVISVRAPWQYLPSGIYPFAQHALQRPNDLSPDHCPKYLISCGRRSVYASLSLKKQLANQVITIHILDPKISSSNFDYVVAPMHDTISGKNVIKTRYGINHITDSLIQSEAQRLQPLFSHINRPIIMVVLGGKNRHYLFDSASIDSMNALVRNITTHLSAHAFVLFSRRTPSHIQAQCQDTFRHDEHVSVWTDNTVNPYLALLGLSDYVFLTCDSASMISEAITAKKSTYVFQLPKRRSQSRLQLFIDGLVQQKIIGHLQMPLPTLRPVLISETTQVAQQLLAARSL